MQEFTKVDESLPCELHVTNKKQLFSHEMKIGGSRLLIISPDDNEVRVG